MKETDAESSDQMGAVIGSLHPQSLADLIALKKFSEAQIRSFTKLWGEDLPSSRSREHLLRWILVEFGFGRVRSPNFYTDALSSLFPPADILREVRQLNLIGLIIRTEADELIPAQIVIDWYNRMMPIVMEEVAEVMRSR